MKREELGELMVFATVVEEGSFTRAATRLRTSQSAVSTAVRRLEQRVGVRLLARTTRQLSVTEAGEALIAIVAPAFRDIDAGLTHVRDLMRIPSGTIRLTATKHPARTILSPVARRLMSAFPDISIEISVDQRLVSIVQEKFDAGVRIGESIEQDMIAMRIGPDLRMAVVGSPAYFHDHPQPRTPHDLTAHRSVNLRLPSSGGLYVWEFEKDGAPLNVRVDGQYVCNDTDMMIEAAVEGVGLICTSEDQVEGHLQGGRLVRVLVDWCPTFPGYHLYYPDRRNHSAAFRLVLDALKYRG